VMCFVVHCIIATNAGQAAVCVAACVCVREALHHCEKDCSRHSLLWTCCNWLSVCARDLWRANCRQPLRGHFGHAQCQVANEFATNSRRQLYADVCQCGTCGAQIVANPSLNEYG